MANPNQVVCFISQQGLCTQFEWLNPEFQFTATNFTSIASKLSDLGDRTSGANFEMEGHVDMPSQSAEDPWSQEPWIVLPLLTILDPRRPPSSCPNIRYCLEIHVTLMEELGAVSPPSHSWVAPLVKDMLCDVRTGLTEAVVTEPGSAVLFYGRHSLGEGLTTDEARDATFLLTGVGTWVVKPAYLATDPMTIQEGWWVIAQAITDHQVKVRGLGHPCVNLSTQQPFRFDHPGSSPLKSTPGEVDSDHQPLPHQPLRGWDCNRCQRDQRPPPPQLPSPSPDCRFESDRSLLLMASLMSAMLDRSEGSQHSQCGRWHQEDGAHMKINLPVFKDEVAKDTVTYQSWRWDLTVYQHAGCWDHTLFPYAIWSLQGYPCQLVQSSSMYIMLDDVLTILDEHYNNTKVLDTLNQELFQLRMADKETVLDWGVHLSRHLQVLAASLPDHFPPDWVAELKRDCFYDRLPKCLKAMVAYLKAGPQVRTYSDYLRAAQEAEKEDSMELPRGLRAHTTDNAPKLWATSFFPLQKLKGNQPTSKTLAVHLAHLEEEDARRNEDKESNNPGRIEGVTGEFMVHLARVVKDAHAEEKCCYHCSSPEHFICNCPLIKTLRENTQLNGKEGMALKKGTWTPPAIVNTLKNLQTEVSKA